MFKILFFIAFLSSCTTPDLWRPEDHRRLMMQCRVACGKGNMATYDAWSAECTCRVRNASASKRKITIWDDGE